MQLQMIRQSCFVLQQLYTCHSWTALQASNGQTRYLLPVAKLKCPASSGLTELWPQVLQFSDLARQEGWSAAVAVDEGMATTLQQCTLLSCMLRTSAEYVC
eukprot:GHUV01042446.1.p1 GENE.GHUV01042446.1~~GHUV01042446.1.p1  ORF type:complete len:101 (+),score=27.82 GHUV01042446.1:261-563(+)